MSLPNPIPHPQQLAGSLVLKLKKQLQYDEFSRFVELEMTKTLGKPFALFTAGMKCVSWKITPMNTFVRIVFLGGAQKKLQEISAEMREYRSKAKNPILVVISLKCAKLNNRINSLPPKSIEAFCQTEGEKLERKEKSEDPMNFFDKFRKKQEMERKEREKKCEHEEKIIKDLLESGQFLTDDYFYIISSVLVPEKVKDKCFQEILGWSQRHNGKPMEGGFMLFVK